MADSMSVQMMLLHMPWYHYALMAVIVLGLAVWVHLRIRRRYWPKHATPRGLAKTSFEQLLILATVELIAAVIVTAAVTGGMAAYHMA